MATEKTKTKTKTKAKATATKTDTVAKSRKHVRSSKKEQRAPHKLMLLVTVIPRSKAEFYLDLLQSFEVNMQLEVSAFGTAGKAFGLLDSELEKQALFSVIREDNVANALAALEEKFASIRGGKGVAFTVPFASMVGVLSYQFLSNKK